MVKEILENAVKQIEANRTQQLAVLAQKVRAEKVIPYNAELDKKRDRAIAEEREKFNTNVAKLQAEFNTTVEQISQASEETKKAFEKSAIESATASINVLCDKAIASLEKQISEVKE